MPVSVAMEGCDAEAPEGGIYMAERKNRPWLSILKRHSRELTLTAAALGTAIAPIAAATSASADTAEMHKIADAPAQESAFPVVKAAEPTALHSHKREHVVATTYTVVPGDNLWDIAGAHLGDHTRWHEIYDANKGKVQPDGESLTDPDLIQPGWVLDLPGGSAGNLPQGGNNGESGNPAPTPAPTPTPSPSSGATQTQNGMYTPVIAPDCPGTASGYCAHDPSYWIPLVEQAEQIVPLTGGEQTDAIVTRITIESSGDPNAINNYDSNAAAGDPSRGLMQTIGATFNNWHVAGTSDNIYDPLANLCAALSYINDVYGGQVPLGSTY